MSIPDAASEQGDLPLDGVHPQQDDAGLLGHDPWSVDFADAFADPAGGNLFSAEIENVNASDWDHDMDAIWGDEGGQSAVDDDGGVGGLDFPL
jgi:hypothetical protein